MNMPMGRGRIDAIFIPMWKAIALAALIVIPLQQSQAQTPCPIRLISGDADQDSVKLSFMNKGKLPIQQLSLSCTPRPMNQKTRDAICHTESGLFYPGMEYSIDFPYPAATRHTIAISLKTARLAGGVIWTSRPSQSCRTLRIPRKKKP
jgi:hypothetical protein